MSKRLEELRKSAITLLIIKSIGLFIMAIMFFVGAFIVKSRSNDNNGFILFIVLSILVIVIMIFNIIYQYRKFLKKD